MAIAVLPLAGCTTASNEYAKACDEFLKPTYQGLDSPDYAEHIAAAKRHADTALKEDSQWDEAKSLVFSLESFPDDASIATDGQRRIAPIATLALLDDCEKAQE